METKVYSLFLALRFLVISFCRCFSSSLSRSLRRFSSMSLNFFVLVLSINIQALDNGNHQDHTHNGASSVAYQRKGHTCHRNEFGSSADGEKYLECIFRAKSNGDQFIKRILNLQGNLHNGKEKAHAHKDQADCKNTAQLLADRTENKVILYNRNFLRGSLAKSHAKPSAGPDCKQRLHDLVSFILIYRHRILPGADSLPHMSEQVIGDHRSHSASCQSDSQIDRLPGRHIDHHHVGNKEDHRTSQVSGKHQDSHVKTSHHRCQNYFLKGNFPCKKGCHKEHKSKLDHLRGLNAHKGKLRTIAGLGQHKNGCQKDNAHACIDPGKVLQKFHLPDHVKIHLS